MKNDNLLFFTPPGLNRHDGFLTHSWACLKGNRPKFTNIYLKSYKVQVYLLFVMYYMYIGVSGPSLLIESTNSMISFLKTRCVKLSTSVIWTISLIQYASTKAVTIGFHCTV